MAELIQIAELMMAEPTQDCYNKPEGNRDPGVNDGRTDPINGVNDGKTYS